MPTSYRTHPVRSTTIPGTIGWHTRIPPRLDNESSVIIGAAPWNRSGRPKRWFSFLTAHTQHTRIG
jgi:hypothetical protein